MSENVFEGDTRSEPFERNTEIHAKMTDTTQLWLFAYLEHLELHPWDCPRLQELLGNGCDIIPVDDDAAI